MAGAQQGWSWCCGSHGAQGGREREANDVIMVLPEPRGFTSSLPKRQNRKTTELSLQIAVLSLALLHRKWMAVLISSTTPLKTGFSWVSSPGRCCSCKKMQNSLVCSFLRGAWEIKPYTGMVIRLWNAVGMTSAPLLSSLFCREQHLPGLEQSRNTSPSLFLLNDKLDNVPGLQRLLIKLECQLG